MIPLLIHQGSDKEILQKQLIAFGLIPLTGSRKKSCGFFPVSLVMCEIPYRGSSQQDNKD